MQNFCDSSCAVRGAFFFSFAIFSMLLGLFSTTGLYGHAASALAPPPAAPSGLKATPISSAHIDLTWTDNANDEAGFKIEIKPADSGTFTQIATVGANVTNYSSTGLLTSTMYVYRVRAYNAAGHSAYSNEVSATTLPDIPFAPTNLKAVTVSQNQINLTWTDNSSDEIGFRIERKTSSAAAYTPITTVGANVTNFANTELSPNTTYFFRVLAYNSGGDSDYSNTAEAKTLPILPAAPSHLTATAISATQITLAWTDNAGNESGFKIERKNGATGTYTQIAAVGANVKSYSNKTGLGPNTNYFYRVRAYNAAGHSDYSNEANAKTLPLAPAAPGNLTAATAGSNKIALAWTDNAGNESGFKIERKTATADYAQIAVVGANVKSFEDVNLAATTKYFYRVRAYNAGGHSAFSNEASATTLPNPPTAPNNLTAAAGPRLIKLAWTDNATNESGFKIERKKGAAGTYTQVANIAANKTSFVDSSLSANTEYFYRVRAYNAGGHSGYSNEASATALPNPPAGPRNLTAATISKSRIDLAWADNSGNESGFKIERKTGAAGIYAQIAAVSANVKSYSNTGLSPNTTYFYRVRAYNAGGHSDYSNEANAKTLPLAPAAPGNLTAATAGRNKIVLAWADNADNESGFKIERKKGAAGTYTQVANIAANKTSFVDSSLSANTEYFYRLRAYNAGGHSGYSNEASATTLPNPPAPPGSLTATVISENRIDLAWADNSGNESGFKIERKTLGGAYAEITTVGAGVTGYADAGLTTNTQYFYRVRAYNAGGHSAYSNEAGAIPFSNVNLALNKPVTASSTDSNSTTNHAVDGDLSTYWRSGYVNATAPVAWLRVQLSSSSPVPVGRAVVRWYQNYFAIEYELQVSNDGASWTAVYANSTGTADVQDFSFAQTTAKFVRLYMKKHEKSNYRVIDFEVYANPGAARKSEGVADAATIPATVALVQNYPNPFNPATQIRYELPQAGQVSLIIYNLLGQEVRRLVDKQQAAGYHQVTWNGRDQSGKPVPSGVYLYRLQAGDFVATRRMLMAK